MNNSINMLLKALNYDINLSRNNDFNNQIYHSIGCNFDKKWIANFLPSELINYDFKKALELIMTLSEGDNFYQTFPDEIKSPDYGDNWGRFANYIEINNRAIATMKNETCCCGILNLIKLLPAIPPSAKSWANCIIISQVFPNIYGDGYNKSPFEENSVYGLKINTGYSENIISKEIEDKISSSNQLRAFCDLAHFRGIKTGYRMMISQDQIKVVQGNSDVTFDWNNQSFVELFIEENVKLINLGFEAIFVDSAKHIGGFDMENYTGVGALPSYPQAQYIFNEIRKRSGKTNLSIVGEKSSWDFKRYENMGLTAGTDYITGDNFDAVKKLSFELKHHRSYAPGVEIENDNYYGGISYEQRLNRINTALFAYEFPSDKLPSFMQMNDIFPLRYDTNTHHIMMTNPSYSTDGSSKSHIENLFTKDDGRNYNHQVAKLYSYALCL